MRLTIAAVGRAKAGPGGALTADYLGRAGAGARALGFSGPRLIEIDERKARGASAQGVALLAAVPGARIVALDERGGTVGSERFADWLAAWRDGGVGEAAFLIGGPDGHDADLRARADRLLSFGPMVWPHMLVRAMLAEQLYRALSILGGSPYHRG